MAKPYTLENTVRAHDTAFYEWLGGLHVDYGNISGVARPDHPILRVNATPVRAVAETVNLLTRSGWIGGATAEEMRKNADRDFAVLPLPIATWIRNDPIQDAELRGGPKVFRKIFNSATGQYESHVWPAHYRTNYVVNFWMRFRFTEAHIREWLYGQFGGVGVAEVERLIAVNHAEPWGTMLQSLRFEGTNDLSDLEGVEQRFIRFEATFSLRTWVMREADNSFSDNYPIERIDIDACEFDPKYGDLNEDGIPPPFSIPSDYATDNLFRPAYTFSNDQLLKFWPKVGNARVSYANRSPGGNPKTKLHHTVEYEVGDGDSGMVAEYLSQLDDDGYGILSHSFNYMATQNAELRISQRPDADSEVVTSVDVFALGQTSKWKRFHRFSLYREPVFRSGVYGLPGTPAEVYLNEMNIRLISPGTKLTVTSSDGGTEWVYSWGGLEKEPYLCILVMTATSGGSGVVTVEDDALAPAYSATRTVDETVNVGMVVLAQPKANSLSVRVPKTISVEAVYLQRYVGPYDGHDI